MAFLDILASLGVAFLFAEKGKNMPLIKYLFRFEVIRQLSECYLCCSFWAGVLTMAVSRSNDWRLPFVSICIMWIIVETLNAIEAKNEKI